VIVTMATPLTMTMAVTMISDCGSDNWSTHIFQGDNMRKVKGVVSSFRLEPKNHGVGASFRLDPKN
jgi:hypothetical protein